MLRTLRKPGLSPILATMPSNPRSGHPTLEACGVVKAYSGTQILAGVDLEVAKGASFGLLGLNGAGKTTLIKCMLDFCSVDRGTFKIFGISHTATAARTRLGFVPERFVPPYYLTCREFIAMTSSLAGDEIDPHRIRPLFDELGLDPAALGSPVRQLSKGMTQKLGLAACLLADRDLYVLDEPMSGLDPASRIAVKSALARLTHDGRTLFFTSHVLADVEELCSSIAILDRGAIRFRGSPRELCERYSEANLERAFLRCIHGDEPAIAA
jgi:ABC-2 type transport system ATP-binding protein